LSPAPLSPDQFRAATGVSRETLERLGRYADLLVAWQGVVNLVGRRSLADLWRRHMLDSAQLLPLAPGARSWLDLGSGGGFPGLVLAILGAPEVHLIESDQRKCAFLREAARVSGATVTVHEGRIEAIAPWPVDVVVARACAPLTRLLGYAAPFVAPHTLCLFLKGQDVEKELTEATRYWNMEVERQKSASSPEGTILSLRKVSRV
jgi:16S rRNA (guanine527-N7)-methyltransferase